MPNMAETQTGSFNDGAAYERLMGRWSRLAGRQFLDWCAVPKGLSWLDVGCGNGAFTAEVLAIMAPTYVVGVDPEPLQIDHARTHVHGASFKTADASALPFAGESFDVAAMALAIAFVPDPARAVEEMRRVTRPGGLVATYMWDLPGGGAHLSPIARALRDLGLPAVAPPHAGASRQDVLSALWQDAGLKNIQIAVFRIFVSFTDFDDFWESNAAPIGPLGESLASLTPLQREEVRQCLRTTLPIAADGSIRYEAWANAVKGRR